MFFISFLSKTTFAVILFFFNDYLVYHVMFPALEACDVTIVVRGVGTLVDFLPGGPHNIAVSQC